MGKVAEIATMLECTRPAILIGTETWVNPTDCDQEFFLSTYKLFRKDCNREEVVC